MPTRASLYFQRFALARWHKRGVLLSGLLVLFYTALCFASPEPAEHGVQPSAIAHKSDIIWPLLPGESLQMLASKLYPQSPILQQRFMQKALSLSRHQGISLHAAEKMEYGKLIIVPDADSVHTLTLPIKKAEDQTIEHLAHQGLRLSLQLSAAQASTNVKHPTHFMPTWLGDLSWSGRFNLNISGWHSVKARLIHTSQQCIERGNHLFNIGRNKIQAALMNIQTNYTSNTRQIARTPLRQLYQYPQLALITLSAILLLVLSIVWGMSERRAFQHPR